MTNRIEYIDTAKGICISLVVLFHAKGVLECEYYIDPFLNSFRMPLYFFLSGLFFKDYGCFQNFLIKKTNKLLIPFLFFYITCSVLLPLLLHTIFDIKLNTFVEWPACLWAFIYPGVYPNFPIWFLLCLFLMNIVFFEIQYMVSLFSKYEDVFIGIVCFLLAFIGYILENNGFYNYGNYLKVLNYIPFFFVGFLFKRNNGFQYLERLSKKKVFIIGLIMLIICFTISVILSSLSFVSNYISGITGTLFIIIISKYIGKIPFISYLGRYSIIVLVTHALLINQIKTGFVYLNELTGNANISTIVMWILILLSYYIIIPFMRRYFPYVTAQRPLIKEKV